MQPWRVLLGVTMLCAAAGPVGAQTDKTVAALSTAYARECNSRLQYGAFANRAEREGLGIAATAFRAAALGESVHAARHARVLEDMNVHPAWERESFVIRSTEENLTHSIENELHENRDTYRILAERVLPEYHAEALASFRYARTAEATHASLFAEMLIEIARPLPMPPATTLAVFGPDEWSAAIPFYVCLGDGSVFLEPVERSCPNCGAGARDFRVVGGLSPPAAD